MLHSYVAFKGNYRQIRPEKNIEPLCSNEFYHKDDITELHKSLQRLHPQFCEFLLLYQTSPSYWDLFIWESLNIQPICVYTLFLITHLIMFTKITTTLAGKNYKPSLTRNLILLENEFHITLLLSGMDFPPDTFSLAHTHINQLEYSTW